MRLKEPSSKVLSLLLCCIEISVSSSGVSDILEIRFRMSGSIL